LAAVAAIEVFFWVTVVRSLFWRTERGYFRPAASAADEMPYGFIFGSPEGWSGRFYGFGRDELPERTPAAFQIHSSWPRVRGFISQRRKPRLTTVDQSQEDQDLSASIHEDAATPVAEPASNGRMRGCIESPIVKIMYITEFDKNQIAVSIAQVPSCKMMNRLPLKSVKPNI
jgi:hypothetical protein